MAANGGDESLWRVEGGEISGVAEVIHETTRKNRLVGG